MTNKLIPSIQESFKTSDIQNKLIGYDMLDNKKFNTIKPGDYVRYSIENQFRGGGRVKLVKFPKYFICLNVIKHVSWSVQLTNPTLIIWIKTQESVNKEKAKKDEVYEKYLSGKLVPKKK
jgi:hypothetical protein